MRLRVLVHNVRGLRGGPGAVGRVVDRFAPDLLLLNETGARRRLRELTRGAGLEVASDPPSPSRRRVRNAVLVRPPWRIVRRRMLRFEGSTRWYPRGALIASVGRSGYRLWAVSVHLGLRPEERRRHAEQLSDALRGLDGPVVIGGDLNETSDRPAAAFLSERFWDAWLLGGDAAGETYPSEDPTARIDYLFVSEGVRVERVLVPADGEARQVSDHLPVVAELQLPEPG